MGGNPGSMKATPTLAPCLVVAAHVVPCVGAQLIQRGTWAISQVRSRWL